jgi:hypothetical protein
MKRTSCRTKTPSGKAAPARRTRSSAAGAARHKPRALRDAQSRATLVFRDFVRQLEKLAVAKPGPAPGASR